jgi:hypothetical protein
MKSTRLILLALFVFAVALAPAFVIAKAVG